ncbi:glutaminyl-peptide cyclotransferase [Gammaproteobacteria bacterium]|nr:glutaminyl-peptide cyclotransferase [Gammaproteobacteria bacterium]
MKSVLLLFICLISQLNASVDIKSITPYQYQVHTTYYHNPQFFTQGLAMHQGKLFESSGLYGQSKLIEYSYPPYLPKITKLPPNLFAEGIASNQNALIQLTWQEGLAIEHKEKPRYIPKINQGWGLCFDGHYFIQSDGSNRLYYRYLDLTPAFSIDIHHQQHPVGYLNDLAYHQGLILANIWYQDIILIILPYSGNIIGLLNLKPLRHMTPNITPDDVLNGICTLPNGNILITGKNWPRFYEISFNPLHNQNMMHQWQHNV